MSVSSKGSKAPAAPGPLAPEVPSRRDSRDSHAPSAQGARRGGICLSWPMHTNLHATSEQPSTSPWNCTGAGSFGNRRDVRLSRPQSA